MRRLALSIAIVFCAIASAEEAPVPTSPESAADPLAEYPRLTEAQRDYLEAHGWAKQAGDARALWVDVSEQRLRMIDAGHIVWEVPCATAEKGTGSLAGSKQTPLGWHEVAEKIGDGAPRGQVFRARVATKEVWKPGQDAKEDLVLTRVLILDGLEPGKNRGRDAQGRVVDSRERYIYVHGTNGEDKIGTPSSHGCIRLRNDDVIVLFDNIHTGTPLLITEGQNSLAR